MAKNCPVRNTSTVFPSIIAALVYTAATNTVLADGPVLFAPACEAALAKSALPLRLRDKAAAHLWTGDGYEMSADGESAFHCLVARNHPDSAIPVCFTNSGVDSVMAGVVHNSILAMRGGVAADVKEAYDAKVSDGSFVAPVAPGINYMMSEYTWIHRSAENTFWNTPPHVMFFAPNVTADAVGSASFEEALTNKGVPVVVDAGIHAYMVTFVDQHSDSTTVEQRCAEHPLLHEIRASR